MIGYVCLFTGRYLYTVYIISDSYIGFDQQYDVQIEVIGAQPVKDDMDFDMSKFSL